MYNPFFFKKSRPKYLSLSTLMTWYWLFRMTSSLYNKTEVSILIKLPSFKAPGAFRQRTDYAESFF